MRDNAANYGIQQSGGQSTVGNQAVGPGAKAVSGDIQLTTGTGDTEGRAERLLARLEELLDHHDAELPGTTKATAEILREELTRPEPDRGVLGRLLERLTTLVKPIPPLVTTVTELAKAINGAIN
ncbi:MAG TPA: hypothetical protein VJT49_06900 [Amycolatopsis sp.]|uniref:hypothetical protein n=1 Tax=Amycolatopsis sp. TaxID=37632 RepID=UPI002B4A598E|nr:hypothetical protein [Amycolatopsis sp.]HKS44835.1 hypothetical protein [Amycolatopsis sp.]